MMFETVRRASATTFDARSLMGISSRRIAGGISGRTSRMRRSSVRRNMPAMCERVCLFWKEPERPAGGAPHRYNPDNMNPYASFLGQRNAVEVIEQTAKRLYELAAALGSTN